MKPATSYGQRLDTVRQCSPIWYQMLGIIADRWGSLASSGFPVSVPLPAITHEFDPIPVPDLPSTASSDAMAAPARASAAVDATGTLGTGAAAAPAAGASSTYRPPTTAPWVTIGRCRSYG